MSTIIRESQSRVDTHHEGTGRLRNNRTQTQHQDRGMQNRRNFDLSNPHQRNRNNETRPCKNTKNTRNAIDGESKAIEAERLTERLDHAGLPMTGNISDCLICCQKSDLYAISECLHPICMECAIRIRISDKTPSKLCPQCRAEGEILYFISSPPGMPLVPKVPTETISHPDANKYGIRFTTEYARDCFDSYMADKCSICAKNKSSEHQENVKFPNFAALKMHMNNVHGRIFCRLCCDNRNVLTKDRKIYTNDELQKHLSGQLAAEEGFSGHPKCLFCEERFYDDELQYKHLRKEHCFCSICDEDGVHNCFYKNQQKLNQHNRENHKPCLDPECLLGGIVFRDSVGLEVHRAKFHHKIGSNSRGISLDFNFPSARNRNRIGPGNRDNETIRQEVDETHQNENVLRRIVPSAQQSQPRLIPSGQLTTNEFPALPVQQPTKPKIPYGAPPGYANMIGPQRITPAYGNLTLTDQSQFPTLFNKPGSKLSKQEQTSSSVWDQGSKELFNKPAKPKREEPKRQKINIPREVWPDEMQEKLKAREQGLPDPDPIKPPHWLNLDQSTQKEAKKAKKKKAKTFSASLAEKLADNQGSFASSSSKFDALAEYNEADIDKDINTAIVGTIDWWKASGKNGKASSNLTPTDDGFVRISLPNSSLIDQKISYVPKLTLDESNLSLRSLAEMFAGSSDKEGKSQENTNDGQGKNGDNDE